MSLFFYAVFKFYFYNHTQLYLAKEMLLNPFYPFTFLKISSLKATIFLLSILLIKSNLLRLKGGLIGGLFALILISGILASSSIALGSLVYAYRLNKKSNQDDNQMQDLETVDV
tara:strand:+ start:175 stop:516 length:342 start_codon:yes stop_codon:yes gene_type:complete